MYYVIVLITLIVLPITAVTYYAAKKNKDINYKGRFLKFKVGINKK